MCLLCSRVSPFSTSFRHLPFRYPRSNFLHFALLFSFLHFLLIPSSHFSFGIILPSGANLQRVSPAENAKLATECGFSTESVPGGRRYPWAVSFMTRGQNHLGGTIISPWHILTAAHAFLSFDKMAYDKCDVYGYRSIDKIRNAWTVVYGDDCIRAQPADPMCARPNLTRNRIRTIFVDDGFGDGGCVRGHDWAIVELEEPIVFSARVQPVCLPFPLSHRRIPDGEVLTVTSWGRKDAFLKGDPLIHEIPMRHDAECKGRPWADTMPINVEDYLCAKALNPKDHRSARTCHGDSGSGMEWSRPADQLLPTPPAQSFGSALPPNPSPSPTMFPPALVAPNRQNVRQQNSENNNNGTRVSGTVTPKQRKRKANVVTHSAHSRHVMRAPLAIPQMELMRKWPSRRRDESPREEKGTIAKNGGEIKMAKTENKTKIGEEKKEEKEEDRERKKQLVLARRESKPGRPGRAELVGVTSFGSRQCSSDELARFTRIANYVDKICALTGVCYPLAVLRQRTI